MVKRLQAELVRLNDPAAMGPVTLGVRDAKMVSDTAIRIRGEAEKHGPIVPRGFLSVVQFPGMPVLNVKQSGRLELAQWLSSPLNPLTSRVMVNRVWHHLFSDGLVKTVDNFGVNGDVPSHPELLDHLARRFVRGGWSMKKLVRAIVLTRAYRLSSKASAKNMAIDPDNRLVWHHSPRRLDAEEIRDATLAAAGQLDFSPPKGSPAMELPVVELRNNGPEAQRLAAYARAIRHRSVYLPLLRGLTPISLSAFDFAEQGMVTGARDTTTVAPQALYLLNDSFVRLQSLALADRLLQPAQMSDAQRIDRAYRLTMGRSATTAETGRAVEYLADYSAAVKDSLFAARAGKVADTVPTGNSTRAKKQMPVVRRVGRISARSQNSNKRRRTNVALEEPVPQSSNPKKAAWASFCQALLVAAEFRYLK